MNLLAKTLALAAVAAIVLASGAPVAAADKAPALQVGDKAPAIEATDDQGNTWKSSDHVGKKILVIYFYPADLTGGCTKQACGFRDDMKKLADKGVEVVGISGDSAKNHQVFKRVHHLNFTLLADETGAVAKQFGVPVGKGGTVTVKDAEGNTIKLTRGATISRWTFVIDKNGKVAFVNTKVSAPNDSKQILKVIDKLEK